VNAKQRAQIRNVGWCLVDAQMNGLLDAAIQRVIDHVREHPEDAKDMPDEVKATLFARATDVHDMFITAERIDSLHTASHKITASMPDHSEADGLLRSVFPEGEVQL
jgi:deferrochelatase/peroxidase EfeB